MNLTALPAFADNYIRARRLQLAAILVTHPHAALRTWTNEFR